MTANFEVDVHLKCRTSVNPNYETQIRHIDYPFRFEHQACQLQDNTTVPLTADVSSDARFFVATGVLSMMYCVFIIGVYAYIDDFYRDKDEMPLADLMITAILALFWLSGAAAWSNGTSALKTATNAETLQKLCPLCDYVFTTSFSRLNISLVINATWVVSKYKTILTRIHSISFLDIWTSSCGPPICGSYTKKPFTSQDDVTQTLSKTWLIIRRMRLTLRTTTLAHRPDLMHHSSSNTEHQCNNSTELVLVNSNNRSVLVEHNSSSNTEYLKYKRHKFVYNCKSMMKMSQFIGESAVVSKHLSKQVRTGQRSLLILQQTSCVHLKTVFIYA